MSLALVVGLIVALRRFGAIVPWASLARGGVLAALLGLAASRIPAAGWQVIPKGMALVVAAVFLLMLSGELKHPGRRRDLPGAA
jgi:polyferredoxin